MITIKHAQIEDWAIFKAIRLKSLQSDIGVFGSSYGLESAFTDADWKNRLSADNWTVFFVYVDDKIIGMTGVVPDRNFADKTQAILIASWLEPSYRGQGVSKQLYQARLDFCKNHPTFKRVVTGHRASNIASKMANQKFGFIYSHTVKDHLWPDGTVEDELFYILDL